MLARMNGLHPVLAYTTADGWRPGIGDPSLMGWVTVAAYFFAAWFCAKAAWSEASSRSWRHAIRFWLILSGVLVLLGINKQLDLQTWFTLLGKRVAQSQGWYEHRRIVQAVFIIAIGWGAMLGLRWAWRLVGDRAAELWLPLTGLGVLLCFVVIRAASFHHVDQLLHVRLAGMKLNWVFELAGIAMVALGARARAAARPPRPGPRPRLA